MELEKIAQSQLWVSQKKLILGSSYKFGVPGAILNALTPEDYELFKKFSDPMTVFSNRLEWWMDIHAQVSRVKEILSMPSRSYQILTGKEVPSPKFRKDSPLSSVKFFLRSAKPRVLRY